MRNKPPARRFERATLSSGIQLHDSDRNIVRNAVREFISVMKYALSAWGCALRDVVQMIFKRQLAGL